VPKKKWRGFRSQRDQGQQNLEPMAKQQSRNPSGQQIQEFQLEGRFYTGPIPEPEALAEYERINPGLADRLVTMAEKEQTLRHTILRWRTLAQIWVTAAGQIFGFVIGVLAICLGGFLLYHDKNLAGFTTFLSGVVMLVTAFIYRQNRTRQRSPQPVL
jgi:uncharacterized membrane protein